MAGQSMRDIKRRIRSVKSTQQITKAMEMVAAAKLRRAQQQVTAGLPFAEKLQGVLKRVVRDGGLRTDAKSVHPLLEQREVERVAYVIITADRGLAGGYNANVLRLARETIEDDTREKHIIAIGRKGRDHMVRRNIPLYAIEGGRDYLYVGDELSYDEARVVSRLVTTLYEEGEVDEVIFIHNVFVTAATHEPTVTRLLPISEDIVAGDTPEATQSSDEQERAPEQSATDAEDESDERPIYEPDAETVLNILIPRYIESQVYSILLGAKASEQGARMLAMRNATENADEMIDALTLSFNRARQNSITTELSEIVGGANALAGGE